MRAMLSPEFPERFGASPEFPESQPRSRRLGPIRFGPDPMTRDEMERHAIAQDNALSQLIRDMLARQRTALWFWEDRHVD
jgi:hypothetical protein